MQLLWALITADLMTVWKGGVSQLFAGWDPTEIRTWYESGTAALVAGSGWVDFPFSGRRLDICSFRRVRSGRKKSEEGEYHQPDPATNAAKPDPQHVQGPVGSHPDRSYNGRATPPSRDALILGQNPPAV